MLPTLSDGEVCTVILGDKPIIKNGSIICFKFFGMSVIHRSIGKIRCKNNIVYIERGDNMPIASLVLDSYIIGIPFIQKEKHYNICFYNSDSMYMKIVTKLWTKFAYFMYCNLCLKCIKSVRLEKRKIGELLVFLFFVYIPTILFCLDKPLKTRTDALHSMWINYFRDYNGHYERIKNVYALGGED